MKMYDCGFTKESNWFRYRAGAIIIENDCVLFAGNKNENYLYSIGGGAPIRFERYSKAAFGDKEELDILFDKLFYDYNG